MKRVNTFVDMNSEVVKGSETRTEESSKRAKMKRHIEIAKDGEVAIDAIPLATKPAVIVEYNIDKEGKIGYFKLIRADKSSKRLEEDYERVLLGNLKVMFEPDIKSKVWRNLQGYKVTVWKLFVNCRIQKMNIKFKGGLLGLKDFEMILRVTTAQKGNGAAPKGNGCFECGVSGHFKRDFPKLNNKDGGNGNAQGWIYAVGNAEKRGNASGNPDANVVTGTFL
ncbi:putative reverse transcriptase domain-containing protein [Tanacetum coccineum]